MDYIQYTRISLYIFALTLIVGTFINKVFIKIQNHFPNVDAFMISVAQLFCIITVAYIFESIHDTEPYAPHVLFSSFLVSLQTNMLDNFRKILNI
jgi:uncharacterized membrane protein YoaK (UPF0700 family)